MTISSGQVYTTFVGDGSTTEFTIPFYVPYDPSGAPLAVVIYDPTAHTLVYGAISSCSNYGPNTTSTVTGTQVVTLESAPASGTTIFFVLSFNTIDQPTPVPNTAFYPNVVEQIADFQARQIASLQVAIPLMTPFSLSTYANLGSPTTQLGVRLILIDSTIPAAGNYGTIVSSGGGSNVVSVWSDGTNWRIG